MLNFSRNVLKDLHNFVHSIYEITHKICHFQSTQFLKICAISKIFLLKEFTKYYSQNILWFRVLRFRDFGFMVLEFRV